MAMRGRSLPDYSRVLDQSEERRTDAERAVRTGLSGALPKDGVPASTIAMRLDSRARPLDGSVRRKIFLHRSKKVCEGTRLPCHLNLRGVVIPRARKKSYFMA